MTYVGENATATDMFVPVILNAFSPFSIPILALVDADPYGIDILSVYKYGSASMAHERDTLAASRVKWIGVMASELSESVDTLMIPTWKLIYVLVWDRLCIEKDALLPITKHDQKKVRSRVAACAGGIYQET